MSYFNQGVYKKSYLLEFRMNNSVTDAVAFSVPLQSEDINNGQRISETKTFGGSVIEDYGNDIVNINLSGTTVNNSPRLIYKGSLGTEIKTGNEEIQYINSLISKYGENDKLKGKTVYLYSLSEKNGNQQYWKVAIKNFQMKRNKDKPFSYDWTLQCIGYKDTNSKFNFGDKFSNFLNKCNSIINTINTISSQIYDGISYLRNGLDYIAAIDKLAEDFSNSLINLEYALLSGLEVPFDYIMEASGLINPTSNYAKRFVNSGTTKIQDIAENMKTIAYQLDDLIHHIDESTIPTDVKEYYGVENSTDVKNAWISDVNSLVSNTENLYVNVKGFTGTIGYSVIPGDNGVDDTIVVTYGYSEKKVTTGDTWDSIATTVYGNPSLAAVIALYNGFDNRDELTVGNTIYIPILSATDIVKGNNQIYNKFSIKDNRGVDLYIKNGDFSAFQGDLGFIDGINNVNQAIKNRLQTNIENRVRLTVYGIKATIGSSVEAESYLISSIQETLLQEPRIKTVDRIIYRGSGDNINITVEYTDIDDEKQTFGGVY